jgi:serine/threonine protein kinase
MDERVAPVPTREAVVESTWPTPEPDRLPPGILPILGRYRILRPLGAGGIGQVFVAEHVNFPGRFCALKILHQGRAAPKELVTRFRQEICALAQLSHANIVRADDAGCVGNVVFLVMQLLDGQSLHHILTGSGPLSVPLAAEVTRQTAEGLAYLHQRHIVHRDIKPGNLQYTRAGVVKILDLGVARLRGELARHFEPTSEEVVLGTGDYMAPEQSDVGTEIDIRADVYSLGCTLYRLLTGRVPYPDARGLTAKVVAHHTQPFPQVEREDLPDEIRVLLEQMTAKSPEQRPWPEAVARILADFLVGKQIEPVPVFRPEEAPTVTLPEVTTAHPHMTPLDTPASDSTGLHERTTRPESPAPPRLWTRRRVLAGLGSALALLTGVWAFTRTGTAPASLRNLDAGRVGEPVPLLTADPVVVLQEDGARFDRDGPAQTLTVTGPLLLLFGMTAASAYRVKLFLQFAGQVSAQLVLGYTETETGADFVLIGPDSERGLLAGKGRLLREPAGRLALADPIVWATNPLPECQDERFFEVRCDGPWVQTICDVSFGEPLPKFQKALGALPVPRTGRVGFVVSRGTVTLRGATFTFLA